MAKTKVKAAKKAEPENIEVRFDLHELPTAQHKAGLAGLLVQIDSMGERRITGLLPAETQIPDLVDRSATAAVFRLTRRSVQDLLDDLYAAEVVEIPTRKKRGGSPPEREPKHEVRPSGFFPTSVYRRRQGSLA
jgi:CRISPR-associated protein Cmx8